MPGRGELLPEILGLCSSLCIIERSRIKYEGLVKAKLGHSQEESGYRCLGRGLLCSPCLFVGFLRLPEALGHFLAHTHFLGLEPILADSEPG